MDFELGFEFLSLALRIHCHSMITSTLDLHDRVQVIDVMGNSKPCASILETLDIPPT